jgi:hypothetical protein
MLNNQQKSTIINKDQSIVQVREIAKQLLEI